MPKVDKILEQSNGTKQQDGGETELKEEGQPGDKASHTEEECSVSKLPSKQPSQNDCSAEAEIKTWEQLYSEKSEECDKLQTVFAKLKESLQCSCYQHGLKKPATLPCGHTFCLKCLKKWKKNRYVGSVRRKCPLCRDLIKSVIFVKMLEDVVKIVKEADTLEQEAGAPVDVNGEAELNVPFMKRNCPNCGKLFGKNVYNRHDCNPSAGGKASHTKEECSVSKLPSKQPSQNDCSTEAESKTWEQLYSEKSEECDKLQRAFVALEDALHCGKCTDCLKEPYTFPCGHTFCPECIKKWKKNREAGVRTKNCPKCRNPKKDLISVKVLEDVVKIVWEVERDKQERGQ